MKKIVALLAIALICGLASPSYATGWGGKSYKSKKARCGYICKVKRKYRAKKRYRKRYSKPVTKAVPEIDAAGAAISLALVAGVVSIARERRKSLVAG